MANTNSSGTVNREWFPPSADSPAVLKLYNSLVDEKVPFVPAAGAGSKQISWYACGPTVYDSAHMGHARNYVTFDVIRRVLEDYFGYNIQYVMNVTDVDDKIILRARRNHLLQQYRQQQADASQVCVRVCVCGAALLLCDTSCLADGTGSGNRSSTAAQPRLRALAECGSALTHARAPTRPALLPACLLLRPLLCPQVAQDISTAIQAAVDKQAKKQAAITAQVSSTTDSRQRTELEGALKNEEHKQAQLAKVAADFAALTAGEHAGALGGFRAAAEAIPAAYVVAASVGSSSSNLHPSFPPLSAFCVCGLCSACARVLRRRQQPQHRPDAVSGLRPAGGAA